MKNPFSSLRPGRLLRAIFGEVRFTPPGWPVVVLKAVHDHPLRWAVLLFAGTLLYYGALETQQWWQGHKPRPRVVNEVRQLTASVGVPAVTARSPNEKPKPEPLRLLFSGAAAKLEHINKDNPPGIHLSPAVKGRWLWNNDRSLYFYPEDDWRPGEEFSLSIDVSELAGNVQMKGDARWSFSIPAFTARWSVPTFYTNPKAPEEHQVTATLVASHPVALEQLTAQFAARAVSGASLFGSSPSPFTITEDPESQHCRFFVRSVKMGLPPKEDFVELSVGGSLTSSLGGKPLGEALIEKVRVPDVYSGFQIGEVEAQIIRTSEGEPEQFIFVSTDGYAQPDEMAKNVGAWYLANDVHHEKVTVIGGRELRDPIPVWSSEGELNPAYANDVKRIDLKIVETEKENDDAPLATRHGFKFVQEKPGRLFVRVAKNTKGLGGFLLRGNHVSELTVPEFPKEVHLLGDGGILAINGERKVSVKARGVRHLRLTLARVPASQVNHLAVFNHGTFEYPEMYPLQEQNIGHFHREIIPVPARNDYQAAFVGYDFSAAMRAADSADADASRGLFFVRFEGVRPATPAEIRDSEDPDPDPAIRNWRRIDGGEDGDDSESPTMDRRFVLVTDLGLVAKRNADGSRDMFVQSVSRGEPAAGVQLTVLAMNGEFLAQAATDAQGHAVLPNIENFRREKEPCAITARLGNDLAFMPFKRRERRLQYSRFDIDGVYASEMETLLGFVFTERGVYRPGDAVHVAGIVRRRDWQGELANLPIEVLVHDAKGNELKRTRLALPADGFFDWTTETKESDPTGQYDISLNRILPDDGREQLGRASFRVEDFEPDRTKITTTLNTPPALAWVAPKDVKAAVKLETLFGTPAADRRVTARLDLSAAHFAFSQFPDFTFHNRKGYAFKRGGDEDETAAGKKIDLGELKTNDQGIAEFDLKLERFDSGSFALRFFADGFEPDSGKSVQSAAGTLVSSMPYVVGYKADGQLGYISKDTPRSIKLVCVSPELKQIASPELKAKLTRIRYVSVLTKQRNDNYEYVSTRREVPVSEQPLTIGEAGLDYSLPTAEAAEFRLDLLDGDEVASTISFTVVGKGDPGRDMEHDAELEMKLARHDWNSGDMLEMNLNAPYTGAGLITIEREKVLGWQWFKSTTTSSTQRILVPGGFEGTGYVNVAWVRALDSPEIFASPLSYAVQPFEANKGAHLMNVSVETVPMLKPGMPMQITYSSEANGRMAIFAVDEGILQITGYKLPQPLKRFLEKRALETETWQMLDLILPEFSQLAKQSAFGGDGDANMTLNPFKRRREAPVVFWSGLVECGPQKKQITYEVPDYFDGRLRIMAVAVAGSRIGTGETASTVRSPLVLQPNAPTFVAPGDEFVVSLSVTNALDAATQASDVKLGVTATEHLELLDAAAQTLNVAPGKEGTVRLHVKAKDALGGAELTFTASAGGEEVKRRATMSVRPASPFMTEVRSGWFRLANQDVPLDRTVYPQFRKSEAVASAMPLGLARGLEAYLADYPHGCSEQITSRAMSRLLLAGEVDFGFDQAESAQQIEYAIRLLAGRQASNGGFGYWGSNPGSAGNDFLSVYVMHFLTEAKASGHAPPAGMMDGAMARMKEIARAANGDADVQAAAIYLMTRNGEVTTNYVLNLRDTLEKKAARTWRGSLAGAYLGSTYALLQQRAEGAKLMQAWWAQVDKTPAAASWYGGWANDPQVKQAQGFELLCRHFPEIAKGLGYDQLEMITAPIRANRFNTLTAAHGIMALKAYSALVQKTDMKLNVLALPVNGDPVTLLPELGGMRRTPFDPGLKGLRFTRDAGAGDLGVFYSVTESGYERAPVTKTASDGIEVFRELIDAKGVQLAGLKVGDTATERIRIRNTSSQALHDVSLLDLLPGGFLFAPGGMKAGMGTVPGTEYVDVREDRAAIFLSLPKGDTVTIEYPVKPQCAGTFAVPPVFAECMYDRAVKGHGVSAKITVTSAE